MPIWKLQNVTLHSNRKPRLKDVTLQIEQSVTAVVGYSGAGKSSLLSVLAGMESANFGAVNFVLPSEQETGDRKQLSPESRLPLFWAPETGGLWPHITVRQHITAVSCPSPLAPAHAVLSDSADKLLDDFDLTDRQDALPGQLSQGEQARLAIARALATDAEVLLFDEPLAHVDPARRPKYWDSIRQRVQHRGTTVVFATHEPEIVLREAETVICLNDGMVVYHGSVAELYDDPPDERAASFLGPVNWFSAAECGRWLGGGERAWLGSSAASSQSSATSLRPECVAVTPAQASPIEVVSSYFCGSFAETKLRHSEGRERIVIHRPASAQLKVGEKVNVEIRREGSDG